MQIVNQLAAPLAQSVVVTRQQSTDKAEQVRQAQALRKTIAPTADSYEHEVESSEEISAIHDSDHKQSDQNSKQKKPPQNGETEPPHIDVKV